MWVQLTSTQYITERGLQRAYHPGDWVNVGRQTAALWISRGEARLPEQTRYGKFPGFDGAGLLLLTGDEQLLEGYRQRMSPLAWLSVSRGESRSLPYRRNLILHPAVKLNPERVAIGMNLLLTWELAVPILDYEQLACHIGSEDERSRSGQLLPDLRVPLYDTRLIFARKCKETQLLFDRWEEELAPGGDERHAFLRALYRTPLLVLALPITWTGREIRG